MDPVLEMDGSINAYISRQSMRYALVKKEKQLKRVEHSKLNDWLDVQ